MIRANRIETTTRTNDLVRTRQYITKFIEMRSHLQGCALKLQTVKSHQAMADAMSSTAKAMEMMGDAIDEVMDQEGNEEEQDKIVSQVLDEIGVSFGEEVPDAPSLGTGLKQSSNTEKERIPEAAGGGNDDTALNDLEARLNNLKQ
eukprot:scaffold112016_cov52-Attheya_sp.AAC.2